MPKPLSEVFQAEAPHSDEDLATGETGVEVEATAETETPKEDAPPAEDTTQAVEDEPDYATQIEALNSQLKAFQAKSADETRKRQALESQLQQVAQPKEKVSIFDDEEKAMSAQTQNIMSHVNNMFANLSESMVRAQFPDYDEKYDVFEQLASTDPTLIAGLQNAQNPALYVYQTVKQHENLQKVQSIDNVDEAISLAQQIKEAGGLEKWKLQQLEGMKDEIVKQAINKKVGGIPPSLADATAAAGTVQQWAGPAPLSKVLKQTY